MAEKKNDPTVSSSSVRKDNDGYPEGTHPIRPLAEQDLAAVNKEYRDLPDSEKPDPSTVAQVEVRPDEK